MNEKNILRVNKFFRILGFVLFILAIQNNGWYFWVGLLVCLVIIVFIEVKQHPYFASVSKSESVVTKK